MSRNVYQVFNVTLGEAYIGITKQFVRDRVASFREHPPPAIEHWDFRGEIIHTSSIENFEDECDAALYYGGLMKSLRGSAFKPVSNDLFGDAS